MDLIWTKALHKVIKLSNEAIIERVLIQYGGHVHTHTPSTGRMPCDAESQDLQAKEHERSPASHWKPGRVPRTDQILPHSAQGEPLLLTP